VGLTSSLLVSNLGRTVLDGDINWLERGSGYAYPLPVTFAGSINCRCLIFIYIFFSSFCVCEDDCLLGCCAMQSGPDDGGSKHLWNVGKLLPNFMALHPTRNHLHTCSCENLKSHFCVTDYFYVHGVVGHQNQVTVSVMPVYQSGKSREGATWKTEV
jgi:hypothetical protein